MADQNPGTALTIPPNGYVFKKIAPVVGDNIMRIPEKSSLNFYVITKYICALLNGRGGTLLIGVEKNFLVRGRKLNREDIDKFQRHVDEALKGFSPSVKGHEYTINFHPVVFEEGKKIFVKDIYVIEIHIGNITSDDLYFTHFDECWIKKPDNQIDLVPITDLRYSKLIINKINRNYMEKHMNKTFEAKKNLVQKKVDLYEGKGIEALTPEELFKLKKNVETAMILVQKHKEYLTIQPKKQQA